MLSFTSISLVLALATALQSTAQNIAPAFSTSTSTCAITSPQVSPGLGCGGFQSYSASSTSACSGWTSSDPTQITINGPTCVGTFYKGASALQLGGTYRLDFSASGSGASVQIGGTTYTSSQAIISPMTNNPPIYVRISGRSVIFSITELTPPPTPSMNTRKRQHAAALRQKNFALAHPDCPSTMTRCGIAGLAIDSEAYECVDTNSDLESCGACGVNCELLPGVASGGVTCSSGTCVISKCKSNYQLFTNSNGTKSECQGSLGVHKRQRGRLESRAALVAGLSASV